ncbi:MAG TPA: hypothetical protein VF310_16415, partial [Vicinamibacteria bacterium]
MKFPGLALAAAGAAFTGAYYAAHRAGAPAWGTDALLVLPALMAAVLLWRRGDVPGAARWHWRLLSVGAGVWAVGAALWAGLQLAGRAAVGGQAWQLPLPVPLEAFFVSFLGPMLAAITLGPKP